MPRARALFADTKTTEQPVEYRFFRIHPNQLTQAFDGHHRLGGCHSGSEDTQQCLLRGRRAARNRPKEIVLSLREYTGHLTPCLERAQLLADSRSQLLDTAPI